MRLGLSTVIVSIQFALLLRGSHQTSAPFYTQFIYDHDAVNGSLDSYEISSEENLSVQTPGCVIPTLDFMDPSIRNLVQYPKYDPKCRHHEYPLLGSNQTHIWTIKENFPHFGKNNTTTLQCCYTAITISPTVRGTVASLQDCVPFNETIFVADEFVRVTCDVSYEDFFMFTRKKRFTPLRENPFETPENQTSYNVLILGLSSMSRLNFHRTMPNTLNFLKSIGGIEMMGYSKVSPHILSNVLALLLGMNETELQRTCWPNPITTIDRCPFIWERFKDVGYYTAFLEDSAKYSIFNLNKMGYHGLKTIPTDYYLYPFIREAEKLSLTCMGNKFYFQGVLDYLDSLITTLKSQKLFSIFWESSMTDRNLNNGMLMDHSYEKLLIKLHKSGYLNNTILILLSDQGMKLGDIHATVQGRLEERLPFLYVVPPPSFSKNYTFAYENLKKNSRRLITPYDVHDTLIDLIDFDAVKNEEVFLRGESDTSDAKSISLFLATPNNRTCTTATISSTLCTCLKSRVIPKTKPLVVRASKYLIQYINEMVSPYSQCAPFKVESIVEASELFITYESVKEWRDIALTVRAEPGGGMFAATVRHHEKENIWSVASVVNRINMYSDQSRCVDHYRLKMYCYCQDYNNAMN